MLDLPTVAEVLAILNLVVETKIETKGVKKRVGMGMVMQVGHTHSHDSQKTSVSSVDTNHNLAQKFSILQIQKVYSRKVCH